MKAHLRKELSRVEVSDKGKETRYYRTYCGRELAKNTQWPGFFTDDPRYYCKVCNGGVDKSKAVNVE